MRGVRLNLPPVATCARAKRRHYSEAMALAEIDRLKMTGEHRPEEGPLAAYECGECRAWHVGHVDKKGA